jgi:hypothetical protein
MGHDSSVGMCEKRLTEKIAMPAGPDPSYKAVPCMKYVDRQAWPAGPDWCTVIRTPTPGSWPKSTPVRLSEIKQEQERSVRVKRILQENKSKPK